MEDMRYTEALRKLFEVMEGRPDIKEVKFNKGNDSFEVTSDAGVHVCFGDEFRNKLDKDEQNMTFTVRITLKPRKDDYGRGVRVFYKAIGAANEEQAQDFARQMLEGFLADGVTVETEVVLNNSGF